MKFLSLLLISITFVFLNACSPDTYTVQVQPGQDIIGLNDDHVDTGCILNRSDGTTYTMDVDSNSINNEIPGSYDIEYSYTIDNDTYTCKRTVIVIDDIPPTVTLNPSVDTLIVNTEYSDLGVTASDETSDVTITKDSTLDITTPGTYEIIYTVQDEVGNTTTITRIITVIE